MKFSKEHRRKLKLNSAHNKPWLGKKRSIADRRKMSKSHLGKPSGNKGHKYTTEQLKRLSLAHLGINTGKNHPNWKGGISFEPYSVDWTDDLKRAIRKRDRYTCQICGKEPATFVHHIDYNKKNCSPDNLITLCNSCHAKTNFNRKYWTEYFNGQLHL